MAMHGRCMDYSVAQEDLRSRIMADASYESKQRKIRDLPFSRFATGRAKNCPDWQTLDRRF